MLVNKYYLLFYISLMYSLKEMDFAWNYIACCGWEQAM